MTESVLQVMKVGTKLSYVLPPRMSVGGLFPKVIQIGLMTPFMKRVVGCVLATAQRIGKSARDFVSTLVASELRTVGVRQSRPQLWPLFNA